MSRYSCAGALAMAAAGAAFATSTLAHITLEQPSAAAGSYYKAVFRVGHGCDGAPTQAITVHLPPGVEQAHPMPKAGWALTSADAMQVTWRGTLADAHYDEFVLRLKLPAQPGPVWFRVHQQCERGANDWAEQPASGTGTRGLKRPAALLDVTPAVSPSHSH